MINNVRYETFLFVLKMPLSKSKLLKIIDGWDESEDEFVENDDDDVDFHLAIKTTKKSKSKIKPRSKKSLKQQSKGQVKKQSKEAKRRKLMDRCGITLTRNHLPPKLTWNSREMNRYLTTSWNWKRHLNFLRIFLTRGLKILFLPNQTNMRVKISQEPK